MYDDISIATAPLDSMYPLNPDGTAKLFSGRESLTADPDLGVMVMLAVLEPVGAEDQSMVMVARMSDVPEG